MRRAYSPAFLLRLYETMVRIRLSEESLVEPILTGEVRTPCHLYSGEEAVAAGVCAALKTSDLAFGTHRSHGHYLAKGGSLPEMMAEIFGRATGCCRGRGGSMHLAAPSQGFLGAAPIVAGTVPLAVGAALACSLRRNSGVVVSFFGDGATGEGVLYESLNFAALRRLPVIFACENNYYSTHLPLRECRPHDNIFRSGVPFGVPGRRVDGNDVLAVYEAAQKAVRACRTGAGPVFLEFMTYRLRGHVGPNDNIQGLRTDIRPEAEVDQWRKKDPIPRLEREMKRRGLPAPPRRRRLWERIGREVEEALAFARRSPYPDPAELEYYVHEETKPVL